MLQPEGKEGSLFVEVINKPDKQELPMPPPKRKEGEPSAASARVKKTRAMTSVYPSPGVGPPLGGYATTCFTRAIQCFATQIADAARAVEVSFGREEWELIYLATSERAFDPEGQRPGQEISESLRRLADRGNLAELTGDSWAGGVEGLRKRVAALDYVQAWAMLIAVDLRANWSAGKKGGGRPKLDWAEEEWWTLAFRWRWCQREEDDEE